MFWSCSFPPNLDVPIIWIMASLPMPKHQLSERPSVRLAARQTASALPNSLDRNSHAVSEPISASNKRRGRRRSTDDSNTGGCARMTTTAQAPCSKASKKSRTEADSGGGAAKHFEILEDDKNRAAAVASVQLYKSIDGGDVGSSNSNKNNSSNSNTPSFELRLTGSSTKSKEEFQFHGLPVRHWKHEKRSKDPNTAYRPWVRANRRAAAAAARLLTA